MRIGLLNNMPDAALEATERQFAFMLAEAAGGRAAGLELYAAPAIQRGPAGMRAVARRYRGLDALRDNPPDALIVTGAEPRTKALAHEAYWEELTGVFDWALGAGMPLILSCLAAHAAVLHLDGIERRRLPAKRCGIFDHAVDRAHALAKGLASEIASPHSRWNGLSPDELTGWGYAILSETQAGDVDCFFKDFGRPWLFFQGHPEYEPDSLLKEYTRDARRYLYRESEVYPSLPEAYFPAELAAALEAFAALATTRREPALLREFPLSPTEFQATDRWRRPAATIYRNFLAKL